MRPATASPILRFSYAGTGTLTTPPYFEVTTVGGNESKSVNIAMYDSQGGKHVLSAALVRTDTVNTWDIILTSITGNVAGRSTRRIAGSTGFPFDPQTGAFTRNSRHGGRPVRRHVRPRYGAIRRRSRWISERSARFDGLTQFAGNSTAVAREQDGYESGNLSAVSVEQRRHARRGVHERRQEGPGDAANRAVQQPGRPAEHRRRLLRGLRPTPAGRSPRRP